MGGAPCHLVVIPHTHWDREWYRTHEAFRHRLVEVLDGLLDALESDPEFRHFLLDGQTVVVDDYLAVRPAARERIAKLVRDGRLAVGPWHVLPDQWLVSGEALIRNLRHGLRRARALGGALPIGYVPDPFGHVGQLPQLLAGFGLEGAVLWRGVGEPITSTLFAWEAPDGTRIPVVWLPRGYGHGADLPEAPEALAERLREEIDGIAAFSPVPTLLLMNGTDHAAPQPRLASVLEAAVAQLPDVTAEIGTLPGFLHRALGELDAALPVHRGELRSGLRAPLLPGCASARSPQKRAEFHNDALLTRHLEPLATWLGLLGGRADPEWIDFVWSLVLENHPHDSVCGCSVDSVHEQMDVRFRRVTEMTTAHLARVLAELGTRIAPAPGEGPALAVWNPNAAGQARAEGVLDLDLPVRAPRRRAPPLHVCDASGRALPVHLEVLEPGSVLARGAIPLRWLLRMLAVSAREFFGGWVQRVTVRHEAETPRVEVTVGGDPAPGFDAEAGVRDVADAFADVGEQPVAYEVRRLARVRIALVDAFPGYGLKTYRIARGPAPGATALEARRTPDGGATLANRHWRITVAPDASVTLASLRHGCTSHDALRLVSEGDRGDAYNHDPVPGAVRVERPTRARIRLVGAAHAEAGIAIDADYRVPEGLRADRGARSARHRSLRARLELRLAAEADWVELRVRVDNTVRDHRLRLHVRAPFEARRQRVESAFEVVQRPIAPAADAFGPGPAAERPIGTSPQRRLAVLDDGVLAWTVANRGVAEVEAVPEPDGTTSLALTILRAVGWLSRDDLAFRPSPAGPPLETPGAQVPGRHETSFALRVDPVGDRWFVARARAFASPPRVFPIAGGRSVGSLPLADGDRLIELDDPEIEVSALEPRPDGGAIVRLVSFAEQEREVALRWGEATAGGLAPVDLAERADLHARCTSGGPGAPTRMRLRPGEIRTLRHLR